MRLIAFLVLVCGAASGSAGDEDLYRRRPPADIDGPALQMDGRVIRLTEEQAAQCVSGDGCVLVPRDALRQKLGQTRQQALAGCRNAT
jgi:hypothetical protein